MGPPPGICSPSMAMRRSRVVRRWRGYTSVGQDEAKLAAVARPEARVLTSYTSSVLQTSHVDEGCPEMVALCFRECCHIGGCPRGQMAGAGRCLIPCGDLLLGASTKRDTPKRERHESLRNIQHPPCPDITVGDAYPLPASASVRWPAANPVAALRANLASRPATFRSTRKRENNRGIFARVEMQNVILYTRHTSRVQCSHATSERYSPSIMTH